MPETVHFLDLAEANNDISHCKILKQKFKGESFFKKDGRIANKKQNCRRNTSKPC
jgi:hypothetical protein